ncbi:MAG: class I SAM-dependent methyltransferase [Acidobacteria bacterium]|nr:class I SAM-dependent methyltransferase [Acidobacteriota bacterium]
MRNTALGRCWNLDAALARSVYDFHVPTFFSWLGSTQYLDHETVIGTASTIAKIAAPGSFLVFDYFS